MQAIQTKYLPATNLRGSRIRATCSRGSAIVSYPHELSGDAVHRYAAQQLCRRFAAEDLKQYGTPLDKNPWLRPTLCGGLKDGTCVHVFAGELFTTSAAYLEQSSVSNRGALRKALSFVTTL